MEAPKSRYITLEDFESRYGPQHHEDYEKLQATLDRADAQLVGAFVGSEYSVPIEGLDVFAENRIRQWALHLAGGDTTALADIERAKADGTLNAVRRAGGIGF